MAAPTLAGLERYRQYLLLLARAQVNPRNRDAVDLSGIVQETFLNAHEKRAQFRGSTPGQMAAWLRRILANNLADAMRGLGAAKRDAARGCSLEDALEHSSSRLGAWLAAEQSSPSEHPHGEERAMLLADALATLPELQREALILQYWHACSLAEIGQRLGRTPAAVAGLLKRGLKHLKGAL